MNVCKWKAIAGNINKLYNKQLLNNATMVRLTPDSWTSTKIESYVTLTVQTFKHPAVNFKSSVEK